MSRIFFDEQTERDFARDGYAVVRALSESEAADLLADLRAIQRGHPPEAENRHDSGFYASFLDRDLGHRRRIYQYLKDRLAPRLESLVDGYKVLTATFLEKPPGGGEMDLHCDYTMSADPDDVNLNFWCPLVDVGESNGALQLIPGSHRLVPDISAPGAVTWFAHCKAELKARSRSFALRAGEALIYDSTMPHWSPPNRSGESRFAISLLCVPEGATPALYLAQTGVDGPSFERLDMSDEGYYRHALDDVVGGTVRAKSLGLVGNRNRILSLAEIETLLAARSRSAAGRPDGRGWAGRIRTLLGRPAGGAARPG